jgi:hypothetical protein
MWQIPSSAVAYATQPEFANTLALERSSEFDRRMSGLSTGAVLGPFFLASLAT